MVEVWDALSELVQEDLANWYNVELDNETKERLANLYNNGKFHAWNCPTCGQRVYWGNPSWWGDYQGVMQADYTSYPGDKDLYSSRIVSQQCDDCRSLPEVISLDLVGKGEPDCWVDEGD
jgi:hypothetical protein